MKTRLTLAAVVALALAGLAMWGQGEHKGPPDPAKHVQRHVDFLTKQLSLSAAQQQQATTIFTNVANSEKSVHDQMRTAHENMKGAIEKNDTAAIDQISSSLGNLMAQNMATQAKAHAAFFQTLSPEQQTKFKQMHEQMGGHGMHRHGHGHEGAPPDGF